MCGEMGARERKKERLSFSPFLGKGQALFFLQKGENQSFPTTWPLQETCSNRARGMSG